MPPPILTPSRQLIAGPRGFRKPSRPVLDPNHPINRALGPLGGRWPLGDVASGVTKDATGRHNGTIVGSPTLSSAKYGGRSLALNGSNTYVNVGTGLLITKTTPCWGFALVKITGTASTFLSNWNITVSSGWEWSDSFVVGGVQGIVFPDSGGGNYFGANSATAINDGNWHAIGFDYDGSVSGAGISFYCDGLSDAATLRAAGSGDPGTLVDYSLWIGARQFSGPNEILNGSIEAVCLGIGRVLGATGHRMLASQPWAGVYEAGPRSRIGAVAAGGAFNPGWAYGATRMIGCGVQ